MTEKVIWKDGMFICSQHFQQQDRYHESSLQQQHNLQPFYNWGVMHCQVDESALKLNKILIRKLTGVFPNGTCFSIPDKDSVPDPINVPKNYHNKFIYLGLPLSDRCNLNDEAVKRNVHTKYYSAEVECEDINSYSPEKQTITIGRLNLNLFLENDYLDRVAFIPILKILNANDGIYFDENYIFPCLRVISSNILLGYINKILGLLNSYVRSNSLLIDEGKQGEQLNKVKDLIVLQIISKFKYLFTLMSDDKFLTPYILFQSIVDLVGSLIIFTQNSSLKITEIKFNYNDLSGSFMPLLEVLDNIFKELAVHIAMHINFALEENEIYIASLSNLPSLKNTDFIIGIELKKNGSKEEQDGIIRSVKVASAIDIKRLVSLSVSGLIVNFMSTIPSYVSYNDKTLYFRINKEGDFWQQVIEHKDLALHLNPRITQIDKVHLWVMPQ